MTPDLWVPGLVILAVGAALGWWFTRSGGKREAGKGTAVPERGDGESLEASDLRQRRDDLYARLRDPELSDEARGDLEIQAAKVLKRLDEHSVSSKQGVGVKAEPDSFPKVGPPPVAHSTARTLITGFAFGGGTVALIALLVFWAGRDATPKPVEGGAMRPQPTAEQPHPEGVLPLEIAGEVDDLLARIAANPQDLVSRKELALLYLGSDQFMPAFEQAEAVLAVVPDDIDSLYVQGVVRMTMGQDDLALNRLDRVLELFPNHVRAMTVKGLIAARRGDRDQAAAIWNRALEIAGPQPQIQSLLAMLDSETAGDLPAGHPPTDGPAPEESMGRIATDGYTVRLEADVIAGFAQTGVVFVALRSNEGGAPVAVRRINQPVFPMVITLGPDDMMMAAGDAELPAKGLLTVRLDQDGSASTQGGDDLEGSAEMSRGDLVTIVLN